MAKNWNAYEAAKEIYGNNKENIAEIGSRFPLFARTVALADSDYLLDILKAIPKVTARVIETGLKDAEDATEVEQDIDVEEAETEKPVKAKKAAKVEADDDDETTYESMTSKDLYALCCKRGISSLCKSRSKNALIELLNKYDAGELETKDSKKAKQEKVKKVDSEPVEADDDDWDEDEEQDDVYTGKTAKELFAMCKERGIKTKPKQDAEVYVKLLKENDAESDEEEAEDDDDEWEI